MWTPSSGTTVNGGGINETNIQKAGIYTCIVTAATSSGALDDSFRFSLTMSLSTTISKYWIPANSPPYVEKFFSAIELHPGDIKDMIIGTAKDRETP